MRNIGIEYKREDIRIIAQLQKKGTACLIADVRSESEYARKHIAGTTNIPLERIEKEVLEITGNKKDLPIFTLCSTGQRSKIAAKKLSDAGYSYVRDLGSIELWPYGFVKS